MTYEQYWYGDADMVIAYKKAHKLHIQQKNEELWLQGLYVYNAFGTVLANAFKDKGSTPAKYLEKPIEIFPKKVSNNEEEAIQQREKVIEALSKWTKSWDNVKGKNNNG